mgnify:CR=1 FL=1
MIEDYKSPSHIFRALEDENRSLRAALENLQQSQSAYEKMIGDSNANQLHAEMGLMEFEQIFSAYTDGMWVVREDGIVVRANQPMLDMLGKTNEEVIGHNCSELLKYELCSQDGCPLRNIEFPSTQEFDIQLHGDQKKRHFLLTTGSLLTLDGTPGIVAQFKDITVRKNTEKALEEANQTLLRISNTDGLTRIPNRRCFDETLNKDWKRIFRSQQPISLLMGDIDFFKNYNDCYGHQAGDDCLRLVAEALAGAVLRPSDLVARYGGEEFVLLLPETDAEGALEVGMRALHAITGLKIPHKKSEVRSTISISLGAATVIPEATVQPKDLIALADAALYDAKKAGRNQIIMTKPPMDQVENL